MIFQIPASSPNSSYCNKPWKVLFGGTGINPEEVWIGVVRDHVKHWLFHMNKWTFLLHLFTVLVFRFQNQTYRKTHGRTKWKIRIKYDFMGRINWCTVAFKSLLNFRLTAYELRSVSLTRQNKGSNENKFSDVYPLLCLLVSSPQFHE